MRNYLCTVIILIFSQNVSAQDPEYSQFFANPLYLNPALTGTTELPRIAVNYRNQWPHSGTAFNTYSLSYDQLLPKLNTGIGIQLMHDQEPNNIIKTNFASLSYSYHLKLGYESFMTLGLQAGMVIKQFNTENLVFPSEIDQLSGEITGGISGLYADENKLYADFGIGALGQHGEFFWGAALHHLTRPNESVFEGDQKGRLPLKGTLHAGARLHRLHYGLLSREFTLSPNILYRQQGSFKQINLGIYMIEKTFLFGGWYRNNLGLRPEALIFLVGVAFDRFQFGYSFDFILSKLSNYSYGSHEITLRIFPGRAKELPPRNKLLIPII